MIRDDVLLFSLSHIIETALVSSTTTLTYPFSTLGIVIENRKIDIVQANKRNERERLVIQIADQTCQLFKYTFWGKEAIIAHSKFYEGSIILIDQFTTRKSKDSNSTLLSLPSNAVTPNSSFIEGVGTNATMTYLLYNKYGITIQQERYPGLFQKLINLIKFGHARYSLLYKNYSHMQSNPTTSLSQILSFPDHMSTLGGVQDSLEQNNLMEASFSYTTGYNLCSEGYSNKQPRLNSRSASASLTKDVSDKLLESLRELTDKQDLSLQINICVKIRINNLLESGASGVVARNERLEEEEDFSKIAVVLDHKVISKRWRVLDARTDEPIFICFSSKEEAYNRALVLFDRHAIISALEAGGCGGGGESASECLVVEGQNLLINKGSGRLLKNCHDKLLFGRGDRPCQVQELWVSEHSRLINLSPRLPPPRKRRRAEAVVSDSSGCDFQKQVDRKKSKLFSESSSFCREINLQNCSLIAIRFLCSRLEQDRNKRARSGKEDKSSYCDNVECDAFLWQLFDPDSASFSAGDSARHDEGGSMDNCMELQLPGLRFTDMKFFFLRNKNIIKIGLTDASITSLLGGIPASLLAESLLRSQNPKFCCKKCSDSMNIFHEKYKTLDAYCSASSFVEEENKSLQMISKCARNVIQSLLHTTLPPLAYATVSDSNQIQCEGKLTLQLNEIIESDDRSDEVLDEKDVKKCLYFIGSQEIFSVSLDILPPTICPDGGGYGPAGEGCSSHDDDIDFLLSQTNSSKLLFKRFLF